MNDLISLKRHNYNYAPGLATYAIDGLQGNPGENGNNIYYTNFIISQESDLKQILSAIKTNRLPIKNSEEYLTRSYQNNDIFFDNVGVIWLLYAYEKFVSSESLGIYTEYFKIVGHINLAESDYVSIDGQTGRLIMNSSNYSGFDIVVGYANGLLYVNTNTPLNIVSSIADDNDKINLTLFTALTSNTLNNGQLSLYYETTTNTFHLKSDNPIVVDSDIKILNSTRDHVNGYSSVLTFDDPITRFHELCNQVCYNESIDASLNTRYLNIFLKELSDDLDEQLAFINKFLDYKDQFFVKIADSSLNQCVLPIEPKITKYSASKLNNAIKLYGYVEPWVGGQISVNIYGMSSGKPNYNNIINTYSGILSDGKIVRGSDDKQVLINVTHLPNINNAGLYIQLYPYEKVLPPAPLLINSCMPVFSQKIDTSTNFNYCEFDVPETGYYTLRLRYKYDSSINESDDIMNWPIVDNDASLGLKNGKHYVLSYLSSTTNGVLYTKILSIVEDKSKLYTYNDNIPAISLLIPGNMTDIVTASLMHNTEVLIEKRNFN